MVQDKREGYGVMKYSKVYYEGEWKSDKCNGKGKMIWPEQNEVYEDNFKDNKRHGKGTQKYADWDVYEGNFVQGKI